MAARPIQVLPTEARKALSKDRVFAGPGVLLFSNTGQIQQFTNLDNRVPSARIRLLRLSLT